MKTSDITFGQWTISCEESLTYPDKIWAVYSITHQNELFEIASGIYNYKDAKAIQSIPEMLDLLETFVMWYPELNERMTDAENAIWKIMVERAIQILDK